MVSVRSLIPHGRWLWPVPTSPLWLDLPLRGFSKAHGESAYPIMNLARIGPAIT